MKEKIDQLIREEIQMQVGDRAEKDDGIKFKVGEQPQDSSDKQKQQGEEKVSVELNIRKTLDGKYMVRDHIDIDIIIDPKSNDIVAIPKEDQFDQDIVYNSQNDLMEFLRDKGVIKHDSIEGGEMYASLKADFPDKEETEANIDPLQAVIFSVGKFIEKERPYMEFDEAYFEKMVDRLTDPEDEDTTELGEVPHEGGKGDIDQTTWPASSTYSRWY